MSFRNVYFCSIILYKFKKGIKAFICVKNINKMFGSDMFTKYTFQKWFKFSSKNFANNILKTLVEEKRHQTTRQLV